LTFQVVQKIHMSYLMIHLHKVILNVFNRLTMIGYLMRHTMTLMIGLSFKTDSLMLD
jgi:hypothetical protein